MCEAAIEEHKFISFIHPKSVVFFLRKGFVTWEGLPAIGTSTHFILVEWFMHL